jgi:hypothetical protein
MSWKSLLTYAEHGIRVHVVTFLSFHPRQKYPLFVCVCEITDFGIA